MVEKVDYPAPPPAKSANVETVMVWRGSNNTDIVRINVSFLTSEHTTI